MSHRYKVRTFESCDHDGALDEGTVVMPVDRTFFLYARSIDDVERNIQSEIDAQTLPCGRVYQICPPFGSSESIRAFSVCTDGIYQRTYLDPAAGIASAFRRIRYQDLRVNHQREEATELLQA